MAELTKETGKVSGRESALEAKLSPQTHVPDLGLPTESCKDLLAKAAVSEMFSQQEREFCEQTAAEQEPEESHRRRSEEKGPKSIAYLGMAVGYEEPIIVNLDRETEASSSERVLHFRPTPNQVKEVESHALTILTGFELRF